MSLHNDLVLYHYGYSPFARRIIWYLALRGIDYSQCIQPERLPRPDVDAIGVAYRRIPVLAHGAHIYCDTRAILDHLDTAFPASPSNPALTPSAPADKALSTLLSKWTIEAGMFPACAALLPSDLPHLQDPKFVEDRESLTGRSWKKEDREKARKVALVVLLDAFTMVEEQLLGDGREWVLGNSNGPSRADIEAIFLFQWISQIPNALPADLISARIFPMTYAWISRFDKTVKAAAKARPKPNSLKGPEAAKQVLSSKATPQGVDLIFDPLDPTGLQKGQEVLGFPSDSGSKHQDQGKLVGLSGKESVIERKAPTGETVWIHHPRAGFRIKAVDTTKL